MQKEIAKWLREHYLKVTGSIAFYPVLIALGFLLLSVLMLEVDFSWEGKQFKGALNWIRLRDADTARSIVSTITAGLISLTVFSFSMVMIVLNQAASQLSNRILENLIGNRSQQWVLGIYLGTIVYALFLLTSIRDVDSGTNIPALSIYFLILLTVVDVFVFIYFLHFITQSVKYQTLIQNISKETHAALNKDQDRFTNHAQWTPEGERWELRCPAAGYFQDMRPTSLVKQACSQGFQLEFLYPKGTFLLQDVPFVVIYSERPFSKKQVEALMLDVDFYHGQSIDVNAMYGFRQLTEVAIKALSPGINDPNTAVLCLHALFALLSQRLRDTPNEVFSDEKGKARIFLPQHSFGDLVHYYLQPIWHYGHKDQYVQEALTDLLQQLRYMDLAGKDIAVIESMLHEINAFRGLDC